MSSADMPQWREKARHAVDAIADEDMQRSAWLHPGPVVSSPDEVFCRFFGNANVEPLVGRTDAGMGGAQLGALRVLTTMMRRLPNDLPDHVEPDDLIGDPRRDAVREAAKRFPCLA